MSGCIVQNNGVVLHKESPGDADFVLPPFQRMNEEGIHLTPSLPVQTLAIHLNFDKLRNDYLRTSHLKCQTRRRYGELLELGESLLCIHFCTQVLSLITHHPHVIH